MTSRDQSAPAGARALLVSNWEVYTDAAVNLTTRTLQTLEATPTLGRAAAMRSAIQSMRKDATENNDAFRLHPSYWGAFTLVGADGVSITQISANCCAICLEP